jgi:hypothetical protein
MEHKFCPGRKVTFAVLQAAKAWKHIESTPYIIGVFEIKLIVIKENA